MVKLLVESDYDNFFKGMVEQMIEAKGEKNIKHKTITITAGPYRAYAVAFEHKGCDIKKDIHEELHLDFYSALRTGFGQISEKEIEELIKLL